MIAVNECSALTAEKEVRFCLLELHVIVQQQSHSKLEFEFQNSQENGIDFAVHLSFPIFKHHLLISVIIQGKADAVEASLAYFNGLLQGDHNIGHILHIQGANVHNAADTTTYTIK